MKTIPNITSLLFILTIPISCSRQSSTPKSSTPDVPPPMTFNGSSSELKATEIVPTLDTPIAKGKNVIWCASFLSAWKALEQDLAEEPVSLDGNPEMAALLNNSADPRPFIPATALYIATGWNQKGIINQIENDLRQRFPGKQPPTFPGITPNSFVAYSY